MGKFCRRIVVIEKFSVIDIFSVIRDVPIFETLTVNRQILKCPFNSYNRNLVLKYTFVNFGMTQDCDYQSLISQNHYS